MWNVNILSDHRANFSVKRWTFLNIKKKEEWKNVFQFWGIDQMPNHTSGFYLHPSNVIFITIIIFF